MLNNQEIMITVSHNIKRLFDSQPGSRIGYARQNFISPSCITRWCSGCISDIGLCDAYRIAEYFHVDLDWLIAKHDTERMPAYEYEQQ